MVNEKTLTIKEHKHRARRFSIKEGIFASAKNAFGYHYISPFAVAVNASNSVVALLSAVSGLLGPLTQTFGSRLIEKYSRKKIVRKAVFLEALIWLPLITIAVLFYFGILQSFLPLFVLLSFSFYSIFAGISSPAWFSWMGDVVDQKYRGRWFSKRKLIMGVVAGVLSISSALFLNFFKQNNWTMFGFIILFSLAFISRIICWKIFKRQYEPKIKLRKGYYFSFWDFLRRSPKTNFGKFSIFRSFLGFSTAISSSLLAVYLLRELGFNYFQYMIITLSGAFFALIVLRLWGNLADKLGSYKVLVMTCIFIPLVPIFWILSPNPFYLILVPSLIGGISWAGFNLAERNFIYDNVCQQKRGLAVSYYSLMNGVGIFLGAGLGAILIKYLNVGFVKPLILIYFLGAVVRMIVVFVGIPKMRESKKMKKIGSRKLKEVILKEAKPAFIEEAHEIMSIKSYLETK